MTEFESVYWEDLHVWASGLHKERILNVVHGFVSKKMIIEKMSLINIFPAKDYKSGIFVIFRLYFS